MRKRKFLLIGGMGMLLLICTVAVIFVLRSFGYIPTVQPQQSAQITAPAQKAHIVHEPLPASSVSFLEEHMNSSDIKIQSLAWIPSRQDAYAASAHNPLPSGTKLVIDAKSFWYLKDYGEVKASVGDESFIVHLERFGGQWLIAWTTKI